MYKLIWTFTPKQGMEKRFEAAYGPHGEWVELFRKAEGYLGTELLCDWAKNGSYMTIDTWRSKSDFDLFKVNYRAEYELLDQKFGALTVDERALGTFTSLA